MATSTKDQDFNRNPDGKGGFGDHPEHRSPGGWDKTKTISYQYNRIIRMTGDEFAAFQMNVKENGTLAEQIALQRVTEALTDLATTKEITDRTEGKAPQSIKLDADVNTRPLSGFTEEQLRKLASE